MKDIAAVAVFICAVAVSLGAAGAYPEIGRPLIVESFSIGSQAGRGHYQAYGGSYDDRQFNGHVFNASKVSTSFPASLVVPQNSFNYRPHPSDTDLSSQSYSPRISRQNMQNAYLPPMRPGYLPPPSHFDQTGIQNGGLTPLYQSGYSVPSNMLSPVERFPNAFNSYPYTNPSPFRESTPYGQDPSDNEISQHRQAGGSPDGFKPANSRNAQTYPGFKMPILSLRPIVVPNSPFFPDQESSPPGQAFGPPTIGQSYNPPGIGQGVSPQGKSYGSPGIGNSYTPLGIGRVASPLGQAYGSPANEQYNTPPGIGGVASLPRQAYGSPGIGNSDTPAGLAQVASPPGQAYGIPENEQSYTPPGIGRVASPPGQVFGPSGIGNSLNPPGTGQVAPPSGQSFIPPAIGLPSLGINPAMFPGSFPPSLSLLNDDPLVPAAQSIVQFTSNPADSEYFFSYIVADPVTAAYYRYQELRIGDVVNGFYIVIHPDTHTQTTVFEADENGARKATTLKRYRRDINSTPNDA